MWIRPNKRGQPVLRVNYTGILGKQVLPSIVSQAQFVDQDGDKALCHPSLS